MKQETAAHHKVAHEELPEPPNNGDNWMETPVPSPDTAIQDLALKQAQMQIERLEKIARLLIERTCADFPTNIQREENRKEILRLAEEMSK